MRLIVWRRRLGWKKNILRHTLKCNDHVEFFLNGTNDTSNRYRPEQSKEWMPLFNLPPKKLHSLCVRVPSVTSTLKSDSVERLYFSTCRQSQFQLGSNVLYSLYFFILSLY